MDDLERTSLFDDTVRSGTVRTMDYFPSECIDGFAQGSPMNIFEVRTSKAGKVDTAIGFRDEDSCASLFFCP